MPYKLQIQKQLVQVEKSNSYNDKIKLLKESINIADSNNDIDWGFDLRKMLIEEEKATSRCVEGLPAFTWILETYKDNPDLFSEKEFMLEYKWMAFAACRNVSVSKKQLVNILNDYKSRLQNNGYSLHSYYSILIRLAFIEGNVAQVKQFIDLREKESHDDLSFCKACEVHDRVEYLLARGEFDKALLDGAELYKQKIDCLYAPFSTYAISINHLLAAGYTHQADDFFHKVDKQLQEKNSTSDINFISEIIRYLHLTNQKEKAWEYFEKYVNWSVGCEDYFAFQFMGNILPLLNLSEARKLNVSSELPWYRDDATYSIKKLYDYYFEQVKELARRFDLRSGNHHCAQLVKYYNNDVLNIYPLKSE